MSWSSLPFTEKAKLFNKWSLVQCFGNLCTIFGSIFYFISPYFELNQIEIFIGIGCAINWITLVRYFAISPTYSVITRTIQVAIPMNIKIMAGIAPIFIGYVLFAMCVFWNNREFFSDFSDTCYCFFSMMNGDSILVTFATTSTRNMIVGQVMTYSFVFMAILVWQNMNLVVVEDSYLNVKYKSHYDLDFDGAENGNGGG